MANQLHALSPLDGRYQQRIASLHQFFSEYALIQLRIEVEVRYLLFFLEQTELVIVTNVQRQQILAMTKILVNNIKGLGRSLSLVECRVQNYRMEVLRKIIMVKFCCLRKVEMYCITKVKKIK